MLRNAVVVGGCQISQKKFYEYVRFNNISSVTGGGGGVKFPEKSERNLNGSIYVIVYNRCGNTPSHLPLARVGGGASPALGLPRLSPSSLAPLPLSPDPVLSWSRSVGTSIMSAYNS